MPTTYENYRREIGRHNNSDADKRLREVNQYLQKEHLRVYGTPMPYTYKGGPLPEKFVSALWSAEKSNREMSLFEALLLLMQINQSVVNFKQSIGSIGSQNYKEQEEDASGEKPNGSYHNSAPASVSAPYQLNFAQNVRAQNVLPLEPSKNLQPSKNTGTKVYSRKLLQVEEPEQEQQIREEEATGTLTQSTPTSEPPGDDSKRQADDYIEQLDEEARQKFLKLLNRNLDQSYTKTVRQGTRRIVSSYDVPLSKAILALYNKDTNSSLPFFTDKGKEESHDYYGMFAPTNHMSFSPALFNANNTRLEREVVWHENLHATMHRVANNSFTQTKEENPLYSHNYNPDFIERLKEEAEHYPPELREKMLKFSLSQIYVPEEEENYTKKLRSLDGDIDKVVEVDTICREYIKALHKKDELYSDPKSTVSPEMLKVAKIMRSLDIDPTLTDKSILTSHLSGLGTAIYDGYYAKVQFRVLPTTMNGECLAYAPNKFLPFGLEDEASFVINTVMKEFNPEFYKKNPKAGEFLVEEAKRYRRRLLKKAADESDFYELLTLKEKLHTTLNIDNNMHQGDLSYMVDEIFNHMSAEDKETLHLLLSKYGKTDNLFRQVGYNDASLKPSDIKEDIYYDEKTGSIAFTPDFAKSFAPLPELTSGNDNIKTRHDLKKKENADYFLSLLNNVRDQKVAYYYSADKETIKFVNDPQTAMQKATQYKDFIFNLRKRLQAELESGTKSYAFSSFFEGEISDLYGGEPKNLINDLGVEIDALEHIIKYGEMGLFPSSVRERPFLDKAAIYMEQTQPKANLGTNLKPALSPYRFFVNSLFFYLDQENYAMRQKFEGSDIEDRKKMFAVFDSNVYTRESIAKVINSFPEPQYARFLDYVKKNPGKTLFNDPQMDSFEDKRFIVIYEGKLPYDERREDLRRSAIHDNAKIAREAYLRRILQNSFGGEFSEASKNNIIEALLKEPQIDDLIEAINLAKVRDEYEPFFKNPDLIFIYNDKVMFNLPNLKGELGDYLTECQKAYEFYKKNGYFEDLYTAQQCTDGAEKYKVQGKKKENVLDPFSEYENSTILELNPHHIIKPAEVDRQAQINCANLAAGRHIVALFGLQKTLPGLQTCSENKENRGLLSGEFNATVYEDNSTFRKALTQCSLKEGVLSCG